MPPGNGASVDVAVTVGNTVTARNPHVAGNPVNSVGISDRAGWSAVNYYNIPKLMPRNFRGGGQSAGGSSSQTNVSTNPPVPRRSKPSAVRCCPSADVTRSSKDSSQCHSYYMFTAPLTAASEVNHLVTGPNTLSRHIPRSESLTNVGSSRKEKSTSNNNNNNSTSNNSKNTNGPRLRRRYSVGDILLKLQAAVSSGVVRTVSRFSVSHSSNTPSSPSKDSPDQTTSDNRFFAAGLKQRWASEILRRPPQTDDIVPRKSPTPEKDVPPVPPPRLVVRPKPPAKIKVL